MADLTPKQQGMVRMLREAGGAMRPADVAFLLGYPATYESARSILEALVRKGYAERLPGRPARYRAVDRG